VNCDCSVDSYDFETPDFFREETPKARKPYKCCECREEIKPGQKYHKAVGVWGGEFQTWRTCAPCHAIREEYCPHGYIFGGLAETIIECLGFDYRKPMEVAAND